MMSKKAKVKCEKSPLEGSGIGRVERTIRGDDSRNVDLISNYKSGKVPSRIIPPSKGDDLTPLPGGDRLQSVQRSNQGWVDGALRGKRIRSKRRAFSEHTPRSPNRALRFRFRFSPLRPHLVPIFSGRGVIIAVALLVAIFMGTLTSTLHAQSSESSINLENTPLILPFLGENYPQLEEYIRAAIEENPELQSLRQLYEADNERAREMGVLADPELNIKYDFNPMMSESQLGRFSVSAMQMFPWFGTLSSRREAQRSAAEADRAEIDVRKLELIRDLQISWLDIAELQEQIRIAEKNLELLQDLKPLVDIRYETARSGQADILRIEMEEERMKNRIQNLRDQLNPVIANFNEFLNREPDSDVTAADSLQAAEVSATEVEMRQAILSQNPAFEFLSAQESTLGEQMELSKKEGRPEFGLGLEVMGRDFGPMSMNPTSTESFIGMATIRLPIYRSKTNSQQQQITHRLRSVDHRREQTESRLMTDLESALEQVRTSHRAVRLLDEELITRAEQALDILREEYAVGRAGFDEILQIQRELLDLELERVVAIAEQNRAVVRIESLMGGRGDEL